MSAFASAEAVFGSASRGDSDALSDRDILIVDSDIAVLAKRQAELEALGWSVAAYTFAKLDALAAKGSLFVQHLKDEASIQRDQAGMLRARLDAFRPQASYAVELSENAELANLTAFWPNSRAGALWAADVLYVTVRNFGILHLAQKGKFVFSYSSVLEALVDDGAVAEAAVSRLLKLRFAKSLYRSGERISLAAASEILDGALSRLPAGAFPARSLPIDPAKTLQLARILPPGSPAYHRLRNLERLYISVQALDPKPQVMEKLAVLARWISNPRAYAAFAASLETKLVEQLKALPTESLQIQGLPISADMDCRSEVGRKRS